MTARSRSKQSGLLNDEFPHHAFMTWDVAGKLVGTGHRCDKGLGIFQTRASLGLYFELFDPKFVHQRGTRIFEREM